MATIGLIGAGKIGSQLARLAVRNNHDVVISNSRGPAYPTARRQTSPRFTTGRSSRQEMPQVPAHNGMGDKRNPVSETSRVMCRQKPQSACGENGEPVRLDNADDGRALVKRLSKRTAR